MYDYSKYPICDTDIWVNLCLGGIEEKLFEKYRKVFFASVVRDEIVKWSSGKYSFISEKLFERVESRHAIVIEIDDLDKIDKQIIERQLIEDCGYELGFSTPKWNRRNMGEYLSAIIADHFSIPLMKSNDHLFNEGERGRELYPDLVVKNWNSTVVDLISDIKQRSGILERAKIGNAKMNRDKEEYNSGNASSNDLLKLKEFFCKDR